MPLNRIIYRIATSFLIYFFKLLTDQYYDSYRLCCLYWCLKVLQRLGMVGNNFLLCGHVAESEDHTYTGTFELDIRRQNHFTSSYSVCNEHASSQERTVSYDLKTGNTASIIDRSNNHDGLFPKRCQST